jgi:drug/metabolite transporter (DMT)-like permease
VHRHELAVLRGRTGGWALAAGLLLALHFATWLPSLRFTSVASSTALVSMQVVWTAVLARLVGHAVPARSWAGTVLALAGAVLVTGVDLAVSPRALLGDLLALLGGVFAAGYVIVGAEVRRHVSTTTYTTVCYGVCALVLLGACLAAGVPLAGWGARDWVLLVALTVLAQLLGHSVFNAVLRTTSPLVVSLAILLEVPGATLIAAVALGQVPPLLVLPAVGLVLAGLALVVTGQAPRTDPTSAPPPPVGAV